MLRPYDGLIRALGMDRAEALHCEIGDVLHDAAGKRRLVVAEEYRLAGHRFDQNTDRCVTCGKLRGRIVADDRQLQDERDFIWRSVVESARGSGRPTLRPNLEDLEWQS